MQSLQPLTACPHPTLQSVMLQIAATEQEKEKARRETEKQNYLSEHCPPLHIPGSMAEVQVLGFSHPERACGGGEGRPWAPGVGRVPTCCPPPPQELCKQLHAKIDAAEEEKYDMEVKVQKSSKEVRGQQAAGRGERGRGRLPTGLAPCSWRT